MKKLWGVLLALACCLGSALAEGIPQAVLDVRASVVYIEVYRQADGELIGAGSGSAIGEKNQPVRYVVTNDHVGGEEGTTCIVYYGAYDETAAMCCYTMPERDLCVLKLEEPVEKLIPLALNAEQPQAGDKVYALGFPGSANALFAQGEDTAGDVTVTDGIISAVRRMTYVEGGPDIMALQINAALSAGNSGGPLVNEQGIVVGVNTFGSTTDVNMNGAVAIEELLESLENRGIPYMAQVSQGAPQNAAGWWIAAAVGVLAALGIMAWMILIRRRKAFGADGRPSRRDPSLSGYLAKSEPMSMNMALYLLSGVLRRTAAQEASGGALPQLGVETLWVSTASGRAYLRRSRQPGVATPEQLRGSATGGWTAVYQAGALLYHALSGHPLPHPLSRYEDDEETERTLDTLGLEENQRMALGKALALRPAERYATMGQFLQALEMEQEVVPAKTTLPPLPKVRRPVNRRRVALVLGALCITLTLAGLVGFYAIQLDKRSQAVDCLKRYAFDEAAGLLQGMPNFIKGDVEQLRTLAEAGMLYQQGEYEQALAQFERLGSFLIAPELLEKTQAKMEEEAYRAMMDEVDAFIQAGKLPQAKEQVDAYLFGPAEQRDYNKPIVDEEIVASTQYDLACLYAQYGAYTQAIAQFENLGDYADAQSQLQHALAAYGKELIERDDFMKAYAVLKENRNEPDIKALWDAVIDGLYTQGVAYYNEGNTIKALQYFAKTGNHKQSKKYVKILSSDDVFELLPYLGEAGADKKIYSQNMLEDFLEGTWRNDSYYFTMQSNGNISYNLPWFDYGDYYGIKDGVIFFYYEGDEANGRDIFTIEIESRDVIYVYAHKNGKTYRMTRR